ncbi:MAG: hypothetical protein AB7S49_07465 [Arcobacter sp.]|jgi:hypothetical protein|uniref:Uncharacterized protein n=1 Tax=Arcobacter defluvii TaxID=873191 RepID=A0AAE7BGY3_9BACT|nr:MULTISPECIES: hypothetical protein [Arcobacter]MDY3201367.1 hypothetical protein [Arcobacter sp.]QKF78348.1 hypothetical protein ADFLV_2343 [Arcobacter defluvii]RXI30202.1 hypothetical protein CP964_12250 [Arcobacter defluvii]
MKYNIVVIISIIICAIISWIFSYYLALVVVGESSAFFKIAQLIVVIISMTTFYAPIKYILIKFMNLEKEEREKNE